MKKIKVALIDSGIDGSFTGKVSLGKSILCKEKNGAIYWSDDYSDQNGHGTYCAQIINSYCKYVDFIVIKILDQNNTGSSRALVEALQYLLVLTVDIVNMSLSVFHNEYAKEIEQLCSRLKDNGAIVNVSVQNHEKTSFPASLKSTIGIRGAFNVDSYSIWYNPDIEIQCIANIVPVLVKNIDGTKTFFGGNSKSTALVSGLLAKTMHTMQIDAERALRNLAIKTKWQEDDIQKEFSYVGGKIEGEEFGKFACQVCDLLRLSNEQRKNILDKTLFPPSLYIETDTLIHMIESLSDIYHKKVEIGSFKLSELCTISSLYNYFKREA